MQAASDIFLGWTHDDVSGTDHDWLQLRDMKGSAIAGYLGKGDDFGTALGRFAVTHCDRTSATMQR